MSHREVPITVTFDGDPATAFLGVRRSEDGSAVEITARIDGQDEPRASLSVPIEGARQLLTEALSLIRKA